MCKNLIFHVVFTLLGVDAFTQGSVDIEYFPIDSVNASFIGKEIRIDFKSLEKKETEQSILFGDAFSLKMSNKTIVFFEKWVFYIDEKQLKDQSFRSRSLHSDIQIHEMRLEHMDDTSITVKATIYDVDSTYIEWDKKRKILEAEINKIEIAQLGVDDSDTSTSLSQKIRELKREIRKLDQQEMEIDLEWIKKKKKCSVERLVIKKSVIDGVLVRIE